MKAIEEPNILTYRESKRRALDGDDQPLFRKFGVYKEDRGAFVSRAPQSSIVFDVLRHNVSPGTTLCLHSRDMVCISGAPSLAFR